MSHFYITHCCKQKNENIKLLNAIDRYLASYILYVNKMAKIEKKDFMIFSGKYGLLKPNQKIPYYDKLLTYDDFESLEPVVNKQIIEYNITKITFFHIGIKYDKKVKVYVDFIKNICDKNNVSLDTITLNPAKLILPRNIENDILKQEIKKIKQDKKVLILSHLLQKDLIKEISDHVCSTYDMIRIANESNANTILVCGVTYMGEIVSVFNSKKAVLQPRNDAVCRYTDVSDESDIKDLRCVFKKTPVIAHISTNLKVKYQADYVSDTENLPKLIDELKEQSVIIIGGVDIAEYASRFTDKKIIYNNALCMPCSKINATIIQNFLNSHNILKNNMKIIVTPDCDYSAFDLADEVLTNSQIIKFVENSSDKNFLICAEINFFEYIRKIFPDKNFFQPKKNLICNDMHRVKLVNIYDTLIDFRNLISIPPYVAENIQKKVYGL